MARIGVCDQGPVGRLLTSRLQAHGTEVEVWDGGPLAELVARLARPRCVVIATENGPKVDELLDGLRAHLEAGDLVVHAGNERDEATARRAAAIEASGVHYVALGVGVGPQVARAGSSLMIGASPAGYEAVRGLLEPIAARLPDGACLDRVGPPAAGHFVKVALMGVEYAEMHQIAEVAEVLRRAGGIAYDELARAFAEWNAGELESLFMDATARIFRKHDDATGQPLLDLIVDTSGMKPMGQWVVQSGYEVGAPVPTIAAAVASRALMAARPQRQAASRVLGELAVERPASDPAALLAGARAALLVARLACCAEVFAMLAAAAKLEQWDRPLARVARLWRAGSTIGAALFERVQHAYERQPALASLLLDPDVAETIRDGHEDLRRVVALGVQAGIALPSLSASLSYLDSYRCARLPADIIQAQRDFVGASKYQRTDRDGDFHTEW